MKEPNRIPLDPSTPTAKKVKTFPLNKIYPESMDDDVYIRPDNDSVYVPINTNNENSKQSSET
jgi:hypothetical protein